MNCLVHVVLTADAGYAECPCLQATERVKQSSCTGMQPIGGRETNANATVSALIWERITILHHEGARGCAIRLSKREAYRSAEVSSGEGQ